MRSIVVNIYENGHLTLGHVFYGNTLAEARGVLEAHLKTDSFFRAAIASGKWKGIPLTYTEEVR